MRFELQRTENVGVLAITAAALAALAWGAAWLPFAVLAVGASWLSVARPRNLKAGLAVVAALLVLTIAVSGYGAGKDMAHRDNARTQAVR